MKIGLYYCHCGIDDMGAAGSINADELERRLVGTNDIAYMRRVEFVCSEDGCAMLCRDLEENRPDRVLMTVCSVREHEDTFRGVLEKAGINPFYLQLVNVREHVAWVTEGSVPATDKAVRYLKAAARRVALHEPLQKRELDMCTDVLVIGGGPAGLKAALTLAEAGRQVTIVESTSLLGGKPVRYEEVFPRMECGPCILEPFLAEILHGKVADAIDPMLLSEVAEVSGFFGNFLVKIRRRPRYVDVHRCIGCCMCIEACPRTLPNEVNQGRTERKAIDVEFFGALPNVPFIEAQACTHLQGGECSACQDSCPVDGTICFEQAEEIVEKRVGAIIVATGAGLLDCTELPNLGWGRLPEVYHSYEFERILAANGPTEGNVLTRDGRPVQSVAIIHCAGSLDRGDGAYCSGICCLNAFKFNHLISHKAPGTRVTHFYKTIAACGKEEWTAYEHCRDRETTQFVRYDQTADLQVEAGPDGQIVITRRAADGGSESHVADMVLLMPPVVPTPSSRALAGLLEIPTDRTGFFEELHGRTDAARSATRGIYLAGACQGPKDIQQAMTQATAAAGYALSALVPGRKLTVSPVVATVDETRCAACRSCIGVCPYRAISFDEEARTARVNPVLCVGCGTCVAACPAGVIKGNHFTDDEIYAEMEELLK